MTTDNKNAFQLEIVLPETPLPPRSVISIDVPATDGRLTVMANHQPLIAALQSGSVIIKDENHKIETWHTSAGALQVERNRVTLLVREFETNENNQ